MSIHLEYLIAVAEEQNITRAAKRLYISQPALTKYINQTEEKYGIQIFDRSVSPIRLTEAGSILIREQSKIEAAKLALLRHLELLKEKRTSLTIGTGYGRAWNLIPQVLAVFCERHPDIDIRIESCGELSLLDRLLQGRIDFAAGACDFNRQDIFSRPLRTEQLRLVIPLKYGIFPEGFSPEDSFPHPWVLNLTQLNDLDYISPAEDMGSYTSFQALLYQQGGRFRRQIISNSSQAIVQMVKGGLGYAYIATGTPDKWRDSEGHLPVGCATLPGLPLQRTSSFAYIKEHPYATLLEEMADILTKQVGILKNQ